MARRRRLRWRGDLTFALTDIGQGVHSMLEYRYLHAVERPHRLPAAVRQAPVASDGRKYYLDNLYEDYDVCVELDGRQAHPDDRRWLDVRRDNAVATGGLVTLRYGWADVTSRACATAAEIAAVLRSKGWPGGPRRCGPGCKVQEPRISAR